MLCIVDWLIVALVWPFIPATVRNKIKSMIVHTVEDHDCSDCQ